jgi:hypothetical protein
MNEWMNVDDILIIFDSSALTEHMIIQQLEKYIQILNLNTQWRKTDALNI